jgi:hypothetical protein
MVTVVSKPVVGSGKQVGDAECRWKAAVAADNTER